ncbi:helix-turn-helix domain-containing protein [Streptomyces sp. NPDC056943]|uniref:helix-turn-helix domain-containing protein n=1 Tax=Streptomyces sp. NPDC056943 TaxID=3345971 RepID=UPI0036424B53
MSEIPSRPSDCATSGDPKRETSRGPNGGPSSGPSGDPKSTTVRIASSRLWEIYGSIGLLSAHRGLVPWPYATWDKAARRSLSRADVTIPGWLVHLFRTGAGSLPPFLLTVPASDGPDLSEELAPLGAVCRDRARAELEQRFPRGVPAEVRPLYADPEARAAELRAFLPRYWRAALAPYAATLRAATEEDILRRARTLATQGPEALLNAVGGIAVPGGVAVPGVMAVSGVSRLVLVPLLFGRGTPFSAVSPDGSEAALSYPVEGSAVLVGEAPPERRADTPERGDRLEILIGRSRAGVLRALVVPTTTSDLATTLGLAPSTVSQHLTALVAAGVARRRRAGVRVLYELDRPGVVLLRHLDHARGMRAAR